MFRLLFAVFIIASLLGCQKDSPGTDDGNLGQNQIDKVTIRATTFNLKWYGMKRKGGYEFRNPYLKKFMDQELADSDIILFTEVVSPELLPKVIGHRMDCQDDEFPDGYRNQQRNALCWDRNKFRIEKYDEDYMIPEVAIKKPGNDRTGLRPALHVKLCALDGHCFLQIIGLHLKAGRSWHRRADQMRFVRDELAKQAVPLPTLVMGDMNNYRKERKNCNNICVDESADPENCQIDPMKQYQCTNDDLIVFSDILKEAHNREYKAITRGQKTYSQRWGLDYDHLIITPEIKAKDIKAYPACDDQTKPTDNVMSYNFGYSRYISDHCPVSATLTIEASP